MSSVPLLFDRVPRPTRWWGYKICVGFYFQNEKKNRKREREREKNHNHNINIQSRGNRLHVCASIGSITPVASVRQRNDANDQMSRAVHAIKTELTSQRNGKRSAKVTGLSDGD